MQNAVHFAHDKHQEGRSFNCSSFLRHQAHCMDLSSLQIWRGRLLICGQADARLLPTGSAPSHLPPLHQTLHGSCQLLGCCLQLLVPQHPVQAQLHSFPTPAPAAPVSRFTEEQIGVQKRKYMRGVTYKTCSQWGCSGSNSALRSFLGKDTLLNDLNTIYSRGYIPPLLLSVCIPFLFVKRL